MISEGEEGRITETLGLTDAHCYRESRQAARTYRIAEGALLSIFLIPYMGKNLKQIHVYVTHFAVHPETNNNINNQLYFS